MKNIFIRVTDDQEPISVVVDSEREVVIVDADEYKSLMETLWYFKKD